MPVPNLSDELVPFDRRHLRAQVVRSHVRGQRATCRARTDAARCDANGIGRREEVREEVRVVKVGCRFRAWRLGISGWMDQSLWFWLSEPLGDGYESLSSCWEPCHQAKEPGRPTQSVTILVNINDQEMFDNSFMILEKQIETVTGSWLQDTTGLWPRSHHWGSQKVGSVQAMH